MAEEAKSRGNAAFSARDYATAVEHFTDAIALSPTNHVLYSNRSAAHASLHHYADALKDAKKTVELKPDWSKGYSRLGAAHLGLHQIQDAISAYKKGLEIDPNNEGLKSGLADAQAAASQSRAAPPPSPFGNVFSGPEMWAKLTADPSTRLYLQQPDFVKMMQEIQKNPNNLNLYLKDQRVMQAIGVLLNVKFGGPNSGDDMEIPEETSTPQSSASERKEDKKMEEEKVAEPEPMEVTGEEKEEKEAKERKAQAAKEKELGNAAYKKKEFEKAIEHYTKATELDDEDISYLTNRAAVYLETGKVLVGAFGAGAMGEIKHLVVVKFKEGVLIEEIIKGMEKLVSEVDLVKSFEWGQDTEGPEMLTQGFTHSFSMTFDKKEDYAAFQSHPNHVEYSATFSAAIEKIAVLCFPYVRVKPAA